MIAMATMVASFAIRSTIAHACLPARLFACRAGRLDRLFSAADMESTAPIHCVERVDFSALFRPPCPLRAHARYRRPIDAAICRYFSADVPTAPVGSMPPPIWITEPMSRLRMRIGGVVECARLRAGAEIHRSVLGAITARSVPSRSHVGHQSLTRYNADRCPLWLTPVVEPGDCHLRHQIDSGGSSSPRVGAILGSVCEFRPRFAVTYVLELLASYCLVGPRRLSSQAIARRDSACCVTWTSLGAAILQMLAGGGALLTTLAIAWACDRLVCRYPD